MKLRYPLTLASGSPRRHDLLKAMGLVFDVRVTDIDEVLPEGYDVHKAALYLSELKAAACAEWLTQPQLILTSDTVVVLDGQLLGKPRDHAHAVQGLLQLQNATHTVYTGVTLQWQDTSGQRHQHSFIESTDVTIAPCTRRELEHYVATNEVLDKAGGYGIQDWFGWTKVKRIDGAYSNVMGLPTAGVYQALVDHSLLVPTTVS